MQTASGQLDQRTLGGVLEASMERRSGLKWYEKASLHFWNGVGLLLVWAPIAVVGFVVGDKAAGTIGAVTGVSVVTLLVLTAVIAYTADQKMKATSEHPDDVSAAKNWAEAYGRFVARSDRARLLKPRRARRSDFL